MDKAFNMAAGNMVFPRLLIQHLLRKVEHNFKMELYSKNSVVSGLGKDGVG